MYNSHREFCRSADRPSLSATHRRAFTLVELLVVIVVIVLLIALFLPLSRGSSQRATRQMACTNNLKQIGIALHNYHEEYDSFPPAYTVDANGKPLHSWRTLLLPYLEQQAIYDAIDLAKPWNDPANKHAFDSDMPIYLCPSTDTPRNHTTYLAVIAPGSCLQPIESHSLQDIVDGTDSTLAVVDVNATHAVHWMEPTDTNEQWLIDLASHDEFQHIIGLNVLLLDAGVIQLPADTSTAKLRAMITIAGGEDYEIE